MHPKIKLPSFKTIDSQLQAIGDLANYDPLLSVVKERFQTELTHHLTSLKSRDVPLLTDLKKGNIQKPEVLKEAYLNLGREHAIMKYLFDMAEQSFSKSKVLLLASILFGEAHYRDREFTISNISGDRQPMPAPTEIPKLLDQLLGNFNASYNKRKEHPIVIATRLHYGITSTHPFSDWNGRIARLLLNVALMKLGCLPVLIARDERVEYYEHLEAADKGDLVPLVEFIARKELDSIEGFTNSPEYLSIQAKYELEERLQGLGNDEKCLVLTEDSTSNNLLALILESSGFKMNETRLISYEGCSKIASANLFSIFVKERMPHVHVLVHRDRDYLTEAEIEDQHETFHRIDVRFWVTHGTDIESCFLNPKHIQHCHPLLNEQAAAVLVKDVIEEVLPKSIDYLYKKEFGNKRESSTHLYQNLIDLVEANRFRFTHGKTAYRVLQHRIHDLIREKADLERPSPALHDSRLAKLARSIWK